MRTTWVEDVRKAIALHTFDYIDEALGKIADVRIHSFLKQCRTGDLPQDWVQLVESLEQQGYIEDAEHVYLVGCYLNLSSGTRKYSEDPYAEGRIEFCEKETYYSNRALDIVRRYHDKPCELCFLTEFARMAGILRHGKSEIEGYEIVVQSYRQLANQQPDLYQNLIIETLASYVQALAKQAETDKAIIVCAELIEFASASYKREPEIYRQFYIEMILLFAGILVDTTRYKEAERVYVKAFGLLVELSEEFENKKVLIVSLCKFVKVLNYRRKYEFSERILTVLGHVISSVENHELAIEFYIQISHLYIDLYIKLKMYEHAEEVYNDVTSFINIQKLSPYYLVERMSLIHTRVEMIGHRQDQSEFRGLCESAKQIHSITEQIPNIFNIRQLIELQLILGILSYRLEEYEEAIRNFIQCGVLSAQLKNPLSDDQLTVGKIEIILAQSYMCCGNHETANLRFELGVQIFRDLFIHDSRYEIDAMQALIVWARELLGRLRHVTLLYLDQSLPDSVKKDCSLIREMLSEAKVYGEKNSQWHEISEIYYLEAYLYLLEHGKVDAEKFRTSLDYYEADAVGLRDKQYLYIDKRKFNLAYEAVTIDLAWEIVNKESDDVERLIGLLESQRQVRVLSQIDQGQEDNLAEPAVWRSGFDDLQKGKGRLAQELDEKKSVLLWVEVLFGAVLFVIQKPGSMNVCMQPSRNLLDSFELLQDTVQNKDNNETLIAGRTVYQELPDDVKKCFDDDSISTLFISACETSGQFPWDCILIPSPANQRASNKKEATYLGLKKLLLKSHGITELLTVLERETKPTKKILIVGDPHNQSRSTLHFASKSADEQGPLFVNRGFSLVPSASPLIKEDATFDTVMTGLKDEFALWLQMGHGDTDEGEQGSYFMALAGDDKLYPRHIAEMQWKQHPIVHLDCCVVGRTVARGGGKFDDHTSAALQAGAACVLSSEHKIDDEYAAEFTEQFYKRLMAGEAGTTVADAMLETRRVMAEEHNYNPDAWAMLNLWGNPWVSVQ